MNENTKGSIYLLIFIVIVYVLWNLSQRDMKIVRDDISANHASTIALVVDFKKNKSYNFYYYKFYVNGSLIDGHNNIYRHQGADCVGKYYELEFSYKNPKFSNIFLDRQIKDSMKIINAGFKLN